MEKRIILFLVALLLALASSSIASNEEDGKALSTLYTAYCYGYLSSQSDKPKMNTALANIMRENASKLFGPYKSLLAKYDTGAFRMILEREYGKGKESTDRGLSIAELYIIREGCNTHALKAVKVR